MTRDNGKTWKNVTPKDLVGARIQTVEDSPHMKGRAYIAAYRFMREHDLKPYIYRTDNYGETWTLLTDGKNGIPDDFPTRVVREDPKQAGPALRRHRVRRVRVVQRRQELAAAAAEPAGDAGHRHQGPSQRSRHLDDGTIGVDHGQHHAAPGAGAASSNGAPTATGGHSASATA